MRWLCLLTLLTCGDPVVEKGFRGEPRFSFTGEVATANSETTFEHALRAAVFWSVDGDTSLGAKLVEHSAISVAVRFPGLFEVNVFERPLDLAWAEPEADIRVGLVLVYEDLNGDGASRPEV